MFLFLSYWTLNYRKPGLCLSHFFLLVNLQRCPSTLASKSFPGINKQYNVLFQTTLSSSFLKQAMENKVCAHVHYKNVVLKSSFYRIEEKNTMWGNIVHFI